MPTASQVGALRATSNLSDLTDPAVALGNLGGAPLASRGDYDLATSSPRSRYLPAFTKYSGNPILAAAHLQASMTSVGWPWLMRVDGIFGGAGPYGETYRCYYSTDHQTTSAAIGLLTATNMLGTWTDHGKVFQDTTGGNQCENPTVIYNELTQTFNLYYHMVSPVGAVAGEVMKLATMSLSTAKSGDSWTISTYATNGIVLDTPTTTAGGTVWPGNGGAGYMRPFRIGAEWYAHYRVGGAVDLSFALARSRDGITWFQDPRQLYFQADKMNDALGRFNPSSHFPDWGSGNVLMWRGQFVWIGNLIPYQTQYESPTPGWTVIAPISRDFRRLLSVPTVLFSSSQTWESSTNPSQWSGGLGNVRYGCSAIVDSDDRIYLAYLNGSINTTNDHSQAANFASGIGLAVGQ